MASPGRLPMVCAIFDAQTDIAPNALESFDDHRCAGIAEACKRHGLHLGLHTLSAVNVAEISPFLRNAVDRYLQAYVDLAARLGAEWVVVHGGYHFTSDMRLRKQAAIDRLKPPLQPSRHFLRCATPCGRSSLSPNPLHVPNGYFQLNEKTYQSMSSSASPPAICGSEGLRPSSASHSAICCRASSKARLNDLSCRSA